MSDPPWWVTLPRDKLIKVMGLNSFMLGEARRLADANDVVAALATRLLAVGVALDRMASLIPLLQAESQAAARF